MKFWHFVKIVLISSMSLFGAAAAADEPEKYALLIGVTTYDQPVLNGLKFPEKDVEALGRVLRDNGYKVDLLLGAKATRQEIMLRLKGLTQKGRNGGVVFVGLSGHGIETFDNATKVNKSYFCPVDTTLTTVLDADGKRLYQDNGSPLMTPASESLVAIDEVLLALGQSNAAHRIIVTDCCRDDPAKARSLRAKSFGTSLKEKDIPENCVMLMACASGERSYEHDEWGHGALFKCLLNELISGTSKTMVEVANNVQPLVVQLVQTKSRLDTQKPRFLITGRVELLFPESDKRLGTEVELKGESEFQIGLSFYYGVGHSTVDEIRALQFFRSAAEQGHPIASAYVGLSYFNGWGGNHFDNVEAIRCVKKSMPHLANLAEMGNDDAALIFGWALCEGIGVVMDKDRALAFWERCAKNGNPEALVEIGALYEQRGDHVKAFSSYLEASRKGSVRGTYSFSRALAGGLDVLKDYKQAFELMEKAREAGMAQAYHQASHYYDASFDESPQNENAENSFRLQTQGYQRGARNAVCYARYYFNGYGVAKNVTKGLELLTEAAKTSPEAQMEIVRRMEKGDGITMDKLRLIGWKRKLLATYLAAARLGHMDSLRTLLEESIKTEDSDILGDEYSVQAILLDVLKCDAFPDTPKMVNSFVWEYVEHISVSKAENRFGNQFVSVMLDASERVTGEDRAMLLDTLAHLYELNGDIVRATEVQAEAVTLTNKESVKEYYTKLKQR